MSSFEIKEEQKIKSVKPDNKTTIQSMQSVELSTAIDLHDCDPDLLKNSEAIRDFTAKICKIIDAKPWGPCQIHNFGNNPDVFGYSMVQLVETSLVSGHFANKTNRIFLDIFSCKYYNPLKSCNFQRNSSKQKMPYTKAHFRK